MATTTTTQTLSILADYEIHHSGADHDNESERETVNSPQPADWPTHHRRIPAFRATNRNLSFEERPGGSDPGEMVFIQVMLHGVWLNAAVSRLWRFTGGRINDKLDVAIMEAEKRLTSRPAAVKLESLREMFQPTQPHDNSTDTYDGEALKWAIQNKRKEDIISLFQKVQVLILR